MYVSGHIYVIGGKSVYPTGVTLAQIEAYNIENEEWHREPDMPVALYHHSAAAYNDNIIVLGEVL